MGTDEHSLTLPDHLVETARRVGYKWPNCDEWLLGFYSKKWASLGTICSKMHDIPEPEVQSALQKNDGEFIEAFNDFWNRRVHDNSTSTRDASNEIALRLAEAATILSTEKITALIVLSKVHEFLDRPSLTLLPYTLLPYAVDFDDESSKAADESIISWAREKLADSQTGTKAELERITSRLDEAQRKLTDGTWAMHADRTKLEAAF